MWGESLQLNVGAKFILQTGIIELVFNTIIIKRNCYHAIRQMNAIVYKASNVSWAKKTCHAISRDKRV